ncbi:MlaD family protein [cf. Phormidesmis sp. LEGE 11477]|uniref:MlaD family protein n=1 Tax=cf. Phormidesmis sp. LEGE 11477 TaxID=1828680 RepID=UPI001881CD24|nr:MlaD family protein [cf. Phormidesmis sp. LEGE 11477]MBE9063101.1 MCE family protein [cf. Phormidesmis sp. LEGE 11477]
MRARTIREGSVGLLILLGIGLFGGLVLWLRGFNPANRPYKLTAEFEDTMGVQIGTPVMYRGVSVGRVMSITPQSNAVEVGLEITARELRIPSEVLVETVESGLIGEVSVEITPLTELSAAAAEISPQDRTCDSSVILCDGDRLEGEIGPSYEALLRSTTNLMDLYADPEVIEELKVVLQNVSAATAQASILTQEATQLTQTVSGELPSILAAARTATGAATGAALQIQSTVEQFSLTANDINGLIGENRLVLVDTLGNLQATSLQLRNAADVLGPTIQSGELIGNLEVLLLNAAQASEDLGAVTASLNTPANLVLIQQTLESARDALSSAQKVMADVDELTGDPELRRQVRELINGLGTLVSSTDSLAEQTEVAQVLEPLGTAINTASLSAADEFTLDQQALDRLLSAQSLASDQSIDWPAADLAVSNSALQTASDSLRSRFFSEATTGSTFGAIAESDQEPASPFISESPTSIDLPTPTDPQQPVLTFDGERYTLHLPKRLAKKPVE